MSIGIQEGYNPAKVELFKAFELIRFLRSGYVKGWHDLGFQGPVSSLFNEPKIAVGPFVDQIQSFSRMKFFMP